MNASSRMQHEKWIDTNRHLHKCKIVLLDTSGCLQQSPEDHYNTIYCYSIFIRL